MSEEERKVGGGGVESEFKDSVNSRMNSPRGLYLRILHLLVGSAFSRVESLEIAAIFEEEIFWFEIGVSDLEAMEESDGGNQLEHDVTRVLDRVGLRNGLKGCRGPWMHFAHTRGIRWSAVPLPCLVIF